jgi:hypothetical protein
MAKTLCDWTRKDIEKRAGELERLLSEPRFYCRKCARCACVGKVLCKPRRLNRDAVLEEARRLLARAE